MGEQGRLRTGLPYRPSHWLRRADCAPAGEQRAQRHAAQRAAVHLRGLERGQPLLRLAERPAGVVGQQLERRTRLVQRADVAPLDDLARRRPRRASAAAAPGCGRRRAGRRRSRQAPSASRKAQAPGACGSPPTSRSACARRIRSASTSKTVRSSTQQAAQPRPQRRRPAWRRASAAGARVDLVVERAQRALRVVG